MYKKTDFFKAFTAHISKNKRLLIYLKRDDNYHAVSLAEFKKLPDNCAFSYSGQWYIVTDNKKMVKQL